MLEEWSIDTLTPICKNIYIKKIMQIIGDQDEVMRKRWLRED